MRLLDKLLEGVEAWHARRVAEYVGRFPECRGPRCHAHVDRFSRGFQIYGGCCSPECHELFRSYLPTYWLLR